MTELTLYGLKNCDTCKKALKALESIGRDVCFIDIRADADLASKVPDWVKELGVDQLLNKRSTTWRGLATLEQTEALNGKAESVMIANPTLIKRPVIEAGQEVYVGWTSKVQAHLT